MRVAGIICEYNPFHNGHRYHIQKTLEQADRCICVMSGNFVQRGEAACVNKFVRAEAAVINGADLVLELPAVFACRSAETFARGAVELLADTGIVSLLSFGSESGDLRAIQSAAAFFAQESPEFQTRLAAQLEQGRSFPAARAAAAAQEPFSHLLQSPNDLLGIEYCKAIVQTGARIAPLPILRKGCGHHSKTAKEHVCSAQYLRRNPSRLEHFSPAAGLLRAGGFPIFSARAELILSAHLRRISPEELAQTADCSEGLEYRLKAAALEGETLEEIISLAKTKRYTRTRICRVILNSYLGITKEVFHPEYFRVLAANRRGAELLRLIKKRGSLPVITNLSKQKIPSKALDIDIAAGNFYALLQQKNRRGGMDYTTSPRFFA